MTRRDWFKAGVASLGATALAHGAGTAAPRSLSDLFSCHYDHILGTSLDLCVVTFQKSAATDAERTVLDEIERLRQVLSVYDPASEVSRLNRTREPVPVSPDLGEVLRAYEHWHGKTGGVLSGQLGKLALIWKDAAILGELPSADVLQQVADNLASPGWHFDKAAGTVQRTTCQPLDLNALGKAYIIDRAARAVREKVPAVSGLLMNLGGDVIGWGSPPGRNGWAVAVQDPHNPHDNSRPLRGLKLTNQSVASSGGYLRFNTVDGNRYSHILDPRTGTPTTGVVGATVVARDCLTANALATALCVLSPEKGLRLVGAIAGSECLIVDANGALICSPGLVTYPIVQARAVFNEMDCQQSNAWPDEYQLQVTIEIPKIEARKYRRPYTAVWIEDDAGKPVRTLGVWGNAPKYLKDLTDWWKIGKQDADLVKAVTRATRGPGKYSLIWDGKDDKGHSLPQGAYTVRVEVHREHGKHLRQSGKIECKSDGVKLSLGKNDETGVTVVEYGKKKQP